MVDAVELHHNSVVAKKLRVTIEWTRTIQRIDTVVREEAAYVDVVIQPPSSPVQLIRNRFFVPIRITDRVSNQVF